MVSFNPKDQQKADLWEGGAATIRTMRTVMWDYNGQQEAVPAIHVNLTSHEDDKERDQYYSAGDAKNMAPSDDGLTFKSLKTGRGGLNDTTNAAYLINSIVGSGFNEDSIADDLSIFDDMDVAFERRPIARIIAGKAQTTNLLIVSGITRMPGEKAKPGGKPATAAGKAAAAPVKGTAAVVSKGAKGAAAISEKAEAAVVEILGVEEGPVSKKKLGVKVFGALKKDADVKAVVALVNDPEWLGADDRPWTYDADEETVSAG